MKKIKNYELDENFRVESGKYPQSRYCTFNIYADALDGVAAGQLTARWETTSLQDWSPNMAAIKDQADAFVEQHNRLAELYNACAEKFRCVEYDGYEIAPIEDAVISNRGTNPTEAVMVADCLAFSPSAGEWSDGQIYWPIGDGQEPDNVNYDEPDDLDLVSMSSDPEDLSMICDNL